MPTVTTTQAFLEFEKALDAVPVRYEKEVSNGVTATLNAIRAAFPQRRVPPAPSPPGNVAVIMGARRPREADLELIDTRVMGSYARRTIVPRSGMPVFDVDIAVVFQADEPYDAYTSYGPEQLLRKVADALTTLRRPLTLWSGQSITIAFDTVSIDVWPALRLWNNTIFQFPREGTRWFRSNPHLFNERFTALDRTLNGRLATVARVMKVWNAAKGNLLPSFYLEGLVMQQLATVGQEDIQASLHRIFDSARAGTGFLSMASADGAQKDLSRSLSYQQRATVTSAFASAAAFSGRARQYESQGYFEVSNLCWRQILGPAFPEESHPDSQLLADPQLAWVAGIVEASWGNPTRAEVLFRGAATAGHPEAALSLARLLLHHGDNEEAKQWLMTAVDRGVAKAAMMLAEQMDVDETGRLTWQQRAGELGDPDALIALGIRASSAGDLSGAEGWYRAAAAAGVTRAMVNLALVLERRRGRGGEVNHWLRLAAERGDLQARCLLAGRLWPDDAEAAERAWESAASDGDLKSMVSLARVCEHRGRIPEAAYWYRQAANKGYTDAAIRFAELGLSGRFMKWRANDKWVAVEPEAWAHDQLRKHYSADPDRAADFVANMR